MCVGGGGDFLTGNWNCAGNCVVLPVDGSWGAWAAFTTCLCGDTVRTRTRLCDNPSPSNNGQPCIGPNEEAQGCEQLCTGRGPTTLDRYNSSTPPLNNNDNFFIDN